jgi:hypothetical protein
MINLTHLYGRKVVEDDVAFELSIHKYKDLITWDDCKKEGIVGFNIVPNIEVGLKGKVDLEDITNVIRLTKPDNY